MFFCFFLWSNRYLCSKCAVGILNIFYHVEWSQSVSNVTDELQYERLSRIILISVFSTVPSCVFFCINGAMLFILRSKHVFCDTCRYILLYNLLIADSVQLVHSQVMFLLSVCRVRLAYSLCTVLSIFANLTTEISPLTLVVMPLERYVAVCHPLRHASIITIRNTALVIVAIWAVSSLNNLARLMFLLKFSFEKMQSLQIKDLCSNIALDLYLYLCSFCISWHGCHFLLHWCYHCSEVSVHRQGFSW